MWLALWRAIWHELYALCVFPRVSHSCAILQLPLLTTWRRKRTHHQALLLHVQAEMVRLVCHWAAARPLASVAAALDASQERPSAPGATGGRHLHWQLNCRQ